MDHEHREKPNEYVVLAILILSLAGLAYAFSQPAGQEVASGTVKEILSETASEQNLLVAINEGGAKREVTILNDYKLVAEGDKIFLRGALFGDAEWSIVDISREKKLFLVFAFFVALVILIGGSKGAYSLIGLLFTFAVIFVFMVPQIIAGASPVWVGISSAAIILVPTLYLSYGFNKKSIAALLGIILSLVFVGLSASFLVNTLQFTGISDASMYVDMETNSSLSLIGLLVAGIIIAAVGVLDDVAVIQASVVSGLAGTNPELRGMKLFKEAMRVGRDHISAVVNTLVLAYTGASLPLLLLLYLQKMPVDYFVSSEVVAEEIVRTLISSSGLLLAVPLTTLIATMMVKSKV